MNIRYRVMSLFFLMAATACGESDRSAFSNVHAMLVIDDPGPDPANGEWLFTGEEKRFSDIVKGADIAEAMLACGAKNVQVRDASMTHTWSVVTPWPENVHAFINCIAQHTQPMTYRVTHEHLSDE
jgi:hypothetical protein